MKKIFLLILISFFITPSLYSQNLFRLITPSKTIFRQIKYPVTVQRVTIIQPTKVETAIRAATFQSALRQNEQIYRKMMLSQNRPIVYMSQNIKQFNCSPENLYGTYNYLKVCSIAMSGDEWKQLRKSKGSGVISLISNDLLGVFHKQSLHNYANKKILDYPFEKELYSNTPAIIHPFSSNKEFQSIFNGRTQIFLYRKYGLKGLLDYTFNKIRLFNRTYGFNDIPEEIVKGTYLEAKLWCDYYGLIWE